MRDQFMPNLGPLEHLPDRRVYLALVEAREALPEDGAPVSTKAIFAAIKTGSRSVKVGPFDVLGVVVASRGLKINRHGGFAPAAIGDAELTLDDVRRGLRAARSALHDAAVLENRINNDALRVLREMAKGEIPQSRGHDSPLHKHIASAVSSLFGSNLGAVVAGAPAVTGQAEYSSQVLGRVTEFFKVVAQAHLASGDERWTEYIDRNYTFTTKADRRSHVQQWVVKPTASVIEKRIEEIDQIIGDTTVRPRRYSMPAKLRAAAARLLPTQSAQPPKQRAL